MNIKTIKFTAFTDQRPGTSGLRKPVPHYQQPHYTESFIQSVFTSLGGVAGKTIVVRRATRAGACHRSGLCGFQIADGIYDCRGGIAAARQAGQLPPW